MGISSASGNISNSDERIVYVPSLSRPEAIARKTLSLLQNYRGRVIVVVEPQEYFAYRVSIPKSVELLKLDKSGQGTKYANLFAKRFSMAEGCKYMLKLDDDCSKMEDTEGRINGEALSYALDEIQGDMDRYNDIGAVSFYDMRYYHFEKRCGLKYNRIQKHLWGVRMSRLSATRNEIYPPMTHEDAIESLFMWADGYKTLRYAKMGLSIAMNTGKGGESIYRNREARIEAINGIIEMFPMCRIIDKDGKINLDMKAYEKSTAMKADHPYNRVI